ncbi:MAG: NIPSNAP family protein [Sphingomicrobium sp.]
MLSTLFFYLAVAAGAAPAAAQPAPLNPQTAVYELRTYYAAPGKLAALNARFRNHTMTLFEKHGMRNVAYWNEQPTAEVPEGRLIYVLAHRSRDAAGASWKAFGSDPAWQAVVAKSEADGKLVAKIDSVFMTRADYSPPIVIPTLKTKK